jgi:hypothetical protein
VTKLVPSGGIIDFFPGPAFGLATSCLTTSPDGRSLVAYVIPPSGQCSLRIYFLPTHFGMRSTSLPIFDTAQVGAPGQFTLGLSGPGVAGYFIAGAAAEYTTIGFAHTDLESSGMALTAPVVGISRTDSTSGFWLDASDGGIFTAGNAPFLGSMGGQHLDKPIVGMANASNGSGPAYWLVASDGGIFTFGDVPFEGSIGGQGFTDIIGMAPTTSPLFGRFLTAPASLASRSLAVLAAIKQGRIHVSRPAVAGRLTERSC